MKKENEANNEMNLLEDDITRYREAYSNLILIPNPPGMPVLNGSLLSDTTYLSLPW